METASKTDSWGSVKNRRKIVVQNVVTQKSIWAVINVETYKLDSSSAKDVVKRGGQIVREQIFTEGSVRQCYVQLHKQTQKRHHPLSHNGEWKIKKAHTHTHKMLKKNTIFWPKEIINCKHFG